MLSRWVPKRLSFMNDSSDIQVTSRLDLASSIVDFLHSRAAQRGERLSERELARHLGVSRSPVRAALSVLLDRGIVDLKAGDGWFVRRLAKHPSNRLIPKSGNLDELVLQIARDRFTGDTAQQFVESDFVKRYKVGRATMRKVLIKLSQDGLVERSRGYGWRFLPMLDNEKSQLSSYNLRLAIEPTALISEDFALDRTRLARCKDEHVRLLDGAIARTRLSYLFEVNSNFHLMLAEFSGNEFFVQAIALQNRLRRIVEYYSQIDRPRMVQSCEEHLAIMEALERDEREWAASLMERHLRAARKHLIASRVEGLKC